MPKLSPRACMLSFLPSCLPSSWSSQQNSLSEHSSHKKWRNLKKGQRCHKTFIDFSKATAVHVGVSSPCMCHVLVHLKSLRKKEAEIFFFQLSHQQIRPSAARETCQIHMNGPALWIMAPECVSSPLPYFKQSCLMVTMVDVKMSYDVTLWDERSRQDIPDLPLSSSQLNICHMNINESHNESCSNSIVICVTDSSFSTTSAGIKLILSGWL